MTRVHSYSAAAYFTFFASARQIEESRHEKISAVQALRLLADVAFGCRVVLVADDSCKRAFIVALYLDSTVDGTEDAGRFFPRGVFR